jgi:hypothetical protein
MDWKLSAGAAAIALAGLSVIGITARDPGGADQTTSAAAGAAAATAPGAIGRDAALDAMAELLDREVEERLRLADELAELRARLARLEASAQPPATPPDGTASAGPTRREAGGSRGELTQAAFIEAGFDPERAAYLQQAHDEVSMAQLYLRDQAAREGWLRSARFAEEQQLLQQRLEGLRDGMSDDEYARYLYALGRPNQVSIRRVLSGSAAETAGLRSGDVLVRYDGQRIYASGEVRSSSRGGEPGETVAVEVLRDGRRIQTYMPRGPLGVSMSADRILPDAPGS